MGNRRIFKIMKLCGNMETENMPLKVNAELAKQMDKSKKIYQEIKENLASVGGFKNAQGE